MSNFSFVFQINTGSFMNRHYTEQQLTDSIKRLFGFVKADKVILGWYPDSDMYRKAVELIHAYKAKAYLWLPVFADILPSLGIKGKSEATQTASSDEQFEFVSPEIGTEHVLIEYGTVAGKVQFDGVFLDRIRYGVPSEDLSRADDITKAAEELTALFHAKSLEVGLDLFAPHLAPFMGQDSQKLGEISDFIKPMMYWKTDAPAGIPYEEAVFGKKINRKMEFNDKSLIELASSCDVFPGIEVNNIPGICSTTPDYVTEKIKYFKRCNCKGVVLSWNCPDASDEMLKSVSEISF